MTEQCRICGKQKPCAVVRELGTDTFVGFECEECLEKENQAFEGLEDPQVRNASEKGPHGYGLYAQWAERRGDDI